MNLYVNLTFYQIKYDMFLKKVGIVGLLKVGKRRAQNKKVGKSRNNRKSRARLKACIKDKTHLY